MKTVRVVSIIAAVILVMIAVLLIFRQPWQKKQMVLSEQLPKTGLVIELWEKPFWWVNTEYATWFVVNENGNRTWHLIDDQYISFRTVAIFVSENNDIIRIETTGITTPLHLVAQYNLTNKNFVAEDEATVSDKKGWKLLKTVKIR